MNEETAEKKTLLGFISEQYNNLAVIFHEKVMRGFLSENHILIEKNAKSSNMRKKYFLKKYHFDNVGRIQEVHSAKQFFAEGGIPVILPLRAKDDSTFFWHDGAFYALFPFVAGIQIDRGTMNKKQISSFGSMLGRLHLRGKETGKIDFKIGNAFHPWNKPAALEKISLLLYHISALPSHNEFDRLAQKNLLLKKSLIEQNSREYADFLLPCDHLIHGDYLDQNIFFDGGGTVSHVFDFEKSGYAPRTQELFRSLFYSFPFTKANNGSVYQVDQSQIKLYLDAYLEIYPMTQNELNDGLTVFYLKLIHGLWVESEHYLKGNNRPDVFLVEDYGRIAFLSENLESIRRILFVQ